MIAILLIWNGNSLGRGFNPNQTILYSTFPDDLFLLLEEENQEDQNLVLQSFYRCDNDKREGDNKKDELDYNAFCKDPI